MVQVLTSEEARAQKDVWKYILNWTDLRTVRAAIELEIPDILEKRGSPMSLSDLSAAVRVPASSMFRIMRFLTYQGIFKKVNVGGDDDVHYAQSPLSRLLMRDKMAPLVIFHRPLGTTAGLCAEALRSGKRPDLGVFAAGDQEDAWTADFLNHGNVFTDAMESHARVTTSAIINKYPGGLKGVGSLVDVGGRHGLALGMLVDAFPNLHGICLDLPQIVSDAPSRDGIEFVGGDMFKSIPEADAVIIMRVLHDWSDKACIEILKKCKEAVTAKTGKVMIVDAIIDEEGKEDEYTYARLALDMTMMAVTVGGKERTLKEWVRILDAAGFTKHKVINIQAIESVIEAYT